jgi:hypothetical protein
MLKPLHKMANTLSSNVKTLYTRLSRPHIQMSHPEHNPQNPIRNGRHPKCTIYYPIHKNHNLIQRSKFECQHPTLEPHYPEMLLTQYRSPTRNDQHPRVRFTTLITRYTTLNVCSTPYIRMTLPRNTLNTILKTLHITTDTPESDLPPLS